MNNQEFYNNVADMLAALFIMLTAFWTRSEFSRRKNKKTTEESLNELKESLKFLKNEADKTHKAYDLSLKKLEIHQAIDHKGEISVNEMLMLRDEYEGMGGNGATHRAIDKAIEEMERVERETN